MLLRVSLQNAVDTQVLIRLQLKSLSQLSYSLMVASLAWALPRLLSHSGADTIPLAFLVEDFRSLKLSLITPARLGWLSTCNSLCCGSAGNSISHAGSAGNSIRQGDSCLSYLCWHFMCIQQGELFFTAVKNDSSFQLFASPNEWT